MNFHVIYQNFLLLIVVQAIDPFEGDLPRSRCLTGRTPLEGCSTTLLQEYANSSLPNMDPPDMNINQPDTWVMLFTRMNQENPEYLDQCGGSVPKNSYYNCTQKTIFVVHGYLESPCLAAYPREMKDQLLFKDNFNVILMDFAWGNLVDYSDSVKNAPVVSKQIALVIQKLMNNTCSTADNMYIIGHSLGAQVAGIAGYFVQNLTGKTVGRITALDAARPGFANASLNGRLDKSDATCVDAIHTDAGDCLPLSLGWVTPIGHADFYPNGGSNQPSCFPYIAESLIKGDVFYAILSLILPFCYHKQSTQYFKESINPCNCQFIGVQCDSYAAFGSGECRSCGTDGTNCAVMGMDWSCISNRNQNGKSYYMDTALQCPYCNNTGIDLQNFPLPAKTTCFS